jgi:murein L,D-transpeptidase YafK
MHRVCSGLVCLFFSSLLCLFTASPAAWAAGNSSSSTSAPSLGAEGRLLHIYQLIGLGKSREALPLADALVRDFPNFKLAQLVRGDLLLAQTKPLQSFGAVPDEVVRNAKPADVPAPAHHQGTTNEKNLTLIAPKLDELREEAALRIRALREQPPAGSLPQAFVQMADITRHALLVDLSRSRLYHYSMNDKGMLSLTASYYITHGRLGADKQKEGDERTPLGIYYITENIDKKRLARFYGSGALAINFPNEFDKRRNRSGSGIWLHGVPSGDTGTFARVPKSSNGCLVLSNPDLTKLMSSIKMGETPIVITYKANWLASAEWQAQSVALSRAFNQWQAARSLGDKKALGGFYSSFFNTYGDALEPWFAKSYLTPVKTAPQHTTVLYYPGQDEFMVATFYDATDPFGRPLKGKMMRKRQYWHKVAGNWQIFFEGALGI